MGTRLRRGASWASSPVWVLLLVPIVAGAGGSSGIAERIARGIDAARAERGAAPLRRDAVLDRVARSRAAETAALPEGARFRDTEPVEDLIRREGMKRFRSATKYLAYQSGYADPASAAIRHWRDYAAAWEQAMDPRWTDLGIAVADAADGTLVVAAVFVERPASPPDVAVLERAVFEAVNGERTRRGLAPLARDPALDEVARAHSRDMARRDFLAHETPEGRTLADRIAAARIGFARVGENLARSEDRDDPVAETVQGWMGSPGHRAGILQPAFTATGVGLAVESERGDLLFTQIFLAPSAPDPDTGPSEP